jgi:hypothetical protein
MKANFFKNINLPLLWRGMGGGLLFAALLLFSVSCEKDDQEPVKTYDVTVQLNYPTGFEPVENATVRLRNTLSGDVNEAKTNAAGIATFTVVAGVYEASAFETRLVDDDFVAFNGLKTDITITDAWAPDEKVTVNIIRTTQSPLVIKELYTGGCQKDDGSGSFQRDPYIILYNNSNKTISLQNLCFAFAFALNAHATNNYYVNGSLSYATEGWIPSAYGIFYFDQDVTLAPGQQVVVAVNAAIDHTPTYSQSINFANSDYYCMYDKTSGFNATLYYPTPSEVIPESHYLKAFRYAGVSSTAWSLSVNSPAFFIFTPEGVTPNEFANDDSRKDLYGGATAQAARKVPVEWIVDGVEVFMDGQPSSRKRLTEVVDAGNIWFANENGFTVYRNVNKEATEAIEANAGKIVYNYSLGTAGVPGVAGSTDPSGIDAEASIRNGAHIIYKDTNNSTNDFHQRSRASLRVEN